MSQKLNAFKEEVNKFLKNKEIEKVKRSHTLDLKKKIGAKAEQELNLDHLTTKKEPNTSKNSLKSQNNDINVGNADEEKIKNGEISLKRS